MPGGASEGDDVFLPEDLKKDQRRESLAVDGLNDCDRGRGIEEATMGEAAIRKGREIVVTRMAFFKSALSGMPVAGKKLIKTSNGCWEGSRGGKAEEDFLAFGDGLGDSFTRTEAPGEELPGDFLSYMYEL